MLQKFYGDLIDQDFQCSIHRRIIFSLIVTQIISPDFFFSWNTLFYHLSHLSINVCPHPTSDQIYSNILSPHVYTLEKDISVTIYVSFFFYAFYQLFHKTQITFLQFRKDEDNNVWSLFLQKLRV